MPRRRRRRHVLQYVLRVEKGDAGADEGRTGVQSHDQADRAQQAQVHHGSAWTRSVRCVFSKVCGLGAKLTGTAWLQIST